MSKREILTYTFSDLLDNGGAKSLTYEKAIDLVQKISSISSNNSECNILLDFRETVLSPSISSISSYLKLSFEMLRYKLAKNCKVANLIPLDKNRLAKAKCLEAAMRLKGHNYRVFTDYDDAIKWLSE